MENEKTKTPGCCEKSSQKNTGGFLSGLAYGLLPHAGCIAFIAFTVLGATAATAFFRPLLLNPYFFHILIALSFALATVSAAIYLKKHGSLSLEGAKAKAGYLSTLYGTTIAVNLLLFMVVFPYTANIVAAGQVANAGATGYASLGSAPIQQGAQQASASTLTLQVAIPCSGHASLISGELGSIAGVTSVKFRSPNLFDVSYDQTKTSKAQILSLEVFGPYPATVVSEYSATEAASTSTSQFASQAQATASDSCSSGSGSCGQTQAGSGTVQTAAPKAGCACCGGV